METICSEKQLLYDFSTEKSVNIPEKPTYS